MGEFIYRVVRRERGWAYHLGEVHSKTFASQWEATAAAKVSAVQMHEPGDDTQVRVQDSPLGWRTILALGRPKATKGARS